MTNRPSEILSAVDPGAQNEYKNALHTILDSHAARLESLERDRERQGKLLEPLARWYPVHDSVSGELKSAARAFLADSPPLSPEAKSSSRGVRFYKRTYPDGSSSVFAIDTAERFWICREDGDIGLAFSWFKQDTDNPIPYSVAVTLRPAIATRWAEAAPQSEWPSDVVKVWESVGDPIVRWAEYDSGKIYISHRNEPLNNYPALAKKAELDGGVSDTGRTIRTVYSRYPSEAEVQREIDTICDRVAATRPSPPVQSEQPGKAEGENEMARRFYCERHEGILKHQISDCLVADLLAFAKQYAASRDSRIAALEAELANAKAKILPEGMMCVYPLYFKLLDTPEPEEHKKAIPLFCVPCDPPKGVPG